MNKKPINPILKTSLELGPTLVFFLIYLRLKERTFLIGGTEYSGFIVATLIFVPILLASVAALWWLTGKLNRMQVFTAFMVIFFGGLTAWFNDESFFKMKTTIVYGLFAIILTVGLWRGISLLQWVLGSALPMKEEGWLILTRRLAMMFAALAVVNEIVWRTMSNDAWVKIETFGFPLALFAFLWLQIVALQRFIEEDKVPGARKD